jgi:hypothetical protein
VLPLACNCWSLVAIASSIMIPKKPKKGKEQLLGCKESPVASTAQGYAVVTAEARCRLQGALLLCRAKMRFKPPSDVFSGVPQTSRRPRWLKLTSSQGYPGQAPAAAMSISDRMAPQTFERSSWSGWAEITNKAATRPPKIPVILFR